MPGTHAIPSIPHSHNGAGQRPQSGGKRDGPFTFADENKRPREGRKVKVCGPAHNGRSLRNDSPCFNSPIIASPRALVAYDYSSSYRILQFLPESRKSGEKSINKDPPSVTPLWIDNDARKIKGKKKRKRVILRVAQVQSRVLPAINIHIRFGVRCIPYDFTCTPV